jgi:hypothetical protein
MSNSTDNSTWSQAFLLWFYTNLGGFIGLFLLLTLGVPLPIHASNSSLLFNVSIAGLASLVALIASVIVVPLAYMAFQKLLSIAEYWPRVISTAVCTTSVFLFILFIAAKAMLGKRDFSLTGIILLYGWTYWVAALGAAAWVYQHELFRPDESAETLVG